MRYILKKLGMLIVTLLLVSVLAFLAFQIIPGDPTTKLLGTSATPEKVEALRETLGLTGSVPARYWRWLTGMLRGDPGVSYAYQQPVRELLADKLPVTLCLSAMSFLFVLLISIPAGVGLAWRANSLVDRFFGVLNQILMSVPSFFIGILFTFLFGLVLKWFTPGEFISYKESVGGFLLNLIFPALAIALPKCTMVVKLLRGNLLSEYGKDYARTAYSRGNDTRGVIRRHLLRNAMLPVVTFLAFTLADIVAGSIIVEQIFTISGLGRLLLSAIGNRDYPVVQAIIVILATIVIVVNTLADVVNQYLDPRLRLR